MKRQRIVLICVACALALALVPVCLLLAGVIGNPLTPMSKALEEAEIRLNGFTEVDGKYFMSLDAEVESFDFTSVVAVAEGAEWRVYPDMNAEQAVEAIGLEFGDNVCYIEVNNGDAAHIYEVVLRRLSMFTVTFNESGGQSEQLTVQEGDLIGEEHIPTKTGYNFVGWYHGDNRYDFTLPVIDNLNLIARWQAKTYTVTYVTHKGAIAVDKQYIDYNSLFVPEIPLDTDDAQFFGWYSEGRRFDSEIWTVDGDVTLEAKWVSTVLDIREGIVYGVTEVGESLSEIEIPEENGIDRVTGIASKAFYYNQNIIAVSIPDSVCEIGEQAFCGAGNLGLIILDGAGLKKVGREAFAKTAWMRAQTAECIYLDSVLLLYNGGEDAVVAEGVTVIADYAFDGSGVTTIHFNEELKYIGEHAFEDCSITEITFPIGLSEIGAYAFFNCKLDREVTLPDHVIVGEYAFYCVS